MDDTSAYALSSGLFLRVLGAIYAVAFASLAVQIRGLAGRRGILPAARFRVTGVRASLRAYASVPTLCRWAASDASLLAQCWAGVAAGVALALGLAPAAMLLLAWILFASLTNACGVFLGYQWDALLAEMGLLAILAAPLGAWPPLASYDPPAAARLALVWLVARLVFSSGVVKLRSGDPTWRQLSALRYHFETQPLPNTAAWYAHQLPAAVHKASAVAMFAIELGAPLLLLLGAPYSYAGAIAIVALMVAIQATGNYGFFNLQTLALCVLVVPDHAYPAWLRVAAALESPPAGAPLWWEIPVTIVAAAAILLSSVTVVRLFANDIAMPPPLQRLLRALAPFRIVNSYGLFAVMTTSRPEIVLEGSDDGQEWRTYEFRWKPGDPKAPPRAVAPHQPRLDWQMWFAALGTVTTNPWFVALVARLLEGSRDVLALLKNDPFPAGPPRYVRALLYDYRFTSVEERRRTGQWWKRELLGIYCPAVEVDDVRVAQPRSAPS